MIFYSFQYNFDMPHTEKQLPTQRYPHVLRKIQVSSQHTSASWLGFDINDHNRRRALA